MSEKQNNRWLVWEDARGNLHDGDHLMPAYKEKYCFYVVREIYPYERPLPDRDNPINLRPILCAYCLKSVSQHDVYWNHLTSYLHRSCYNNMLHDPETDPELIEDLLNDLPEMEDYED